MQTIISTKMIATDIDKSKHLLELGLDPKTADMYYTWDFDKGELNPVPFVKGCEEDELMCLDCWSLSALLEVMRKLNATITLQIIGNFTFLRIKDNGFIWQKDIHVKNPMDAVYGGMLWLLEQGLIKKGE